MAISGEQREIRALKRHLRDLVKSVSVNLDAIHETMTKVESNERGKRMAAICNSLEMSKDMAERFGLGKR